MGVAGAGKTTIGRMLAEARGYRFSDADAFHPQANVEKMRRGERLDDIDREPWLRTMASAIDTWLRDETDVVLACSALKARYRARLLRDPSRMTLVYLKVPPGVARARIEDRLEHFMPADLLDSQFEALEEPAQAIVIDASEPLDAVVHAIQDALESRNARKPR